jgi:hypothetical protein
MYTQQELIDKEICVRNGEQAMKKLRIYLDTSVVSHLKHEDTPDKMNDTVELWDSSRTDYMKR